MKTCKFCDSPSRYIIAPLNEDSFPVCEEHKNYASRKDGTKVMQQMEFPA